MVAVKGIYGTTYLILARLDYFGIEMSEAGKNIKFQARDSILICKREESCMYHYISGYPKPVFRGEKY